MTRKQIIEYCLTYSDSYEDYPFKQGHTTAIRRKSNKKIFALVMELSGKLCINLKCEPMKADFLRSVYRGVKPGWHMNKRHWNTAEVNSDIPLQELILMIEDSFRLTEG